MPSSRLLIALVLVRAERDLERRAWLPHPTGTPEPISAGNILTYIRCPLLEYIIVQFGVFGPILFIVLLRTALARDQAAVGFAKDASALLLAAGARDPDRAGDPVARARQLVGDRLSGRDHPRHRSRCSSSTGGSCSRSRSASISSSRSRSAIVPAFALQLPLFERIQFLSRVVGWRDVADAVRAKLGRGALWGATRRYARDGGGAPLLSARLRSYRSMSCAGGTGTDRSLRDDASLWRQARPEPVLFVSLKRCPRSLGQSFGRGRRARRRDVLVVETKTRVLHFCRLCGYNGDAKT